ncbi:hypothetical protein [uncultured Vagococcus sp.]|uniref:hypothetical protein n=1 Tax=uncultured Vagococcus sp. TaxID=189676 RepID=UPI0028D387EE|nr:hypothetical protein [uncultured Vagococcus sp.]
MKSSEEDADILASYNPQTMSKVTANSSYLDFTETLTQLVGETPAHLIVTNLAYYQAFNNIVNPEHFNKLNSRIIIVETLFLSNYLSEAVLGSQVITKPDKVTYYLATAYFDQAVGNYYAKRYFGKDGSN